MAKSWFLEIGLLILIIATIITLKGESPQINPSDIICQTYAQCTVGTVEFLKGDVVSSPKYSFGFKVGEIIVMDPVNKTATIRWGNGQTTTEPLADLNIVKTVVRSGTNG